MKREELRQKIAVQMAEYESRKKVEIVPIWVRKESMAKPGMKEDAAKGAKKEKPTKYKTSRWHGSGGKSLSRRWNDGAGGVIL